MMPLISFVTPAYNAEEFISELIESVIKQSYSNWELIVVDDCSTDNTVSLVEDYCSKYNNIKLIKRETNSGGCRLPRFDGILAATGDYISSVDADDFLEKHFLEKLLARHNDTNSDIVLGRMVMCNEAGELNGRVLPSEYFDLSIILDGYNAVKMTIGGWKLAMNGMLVKRDMYQSYVRDYYKSNVNCGYIDEVDHRRLLLTAEKISITDAKYYYRMQSNSITHQISLKAFDVLEASELLYNFIKQEYGADETVMSNMEYEYIGVVNNAQKNFIRHKSSISESEKKIIKEKIKSNYRNIKARKMRARTFLQKIVTVNYYTFLLSSYIYSFLNK